MSTHCTHHLRGLCKYSAKCAKCTVVQTVLRLCKHPAGCTRLCKYSAEVAVVVQTPFRVCRLFKVVQIFCRMCSCCTNPPHRLCKHSAAMTQVQLTPTDHPRLQTLLAFTIFLKTILSKIRIETRLLCLPLCLFPLQVSRSSKSGLQWWHICKGKKTGEHFKIAKPEKCQKFCQSSQCDLPLQLFNKHCQVPLESYFNSSPLHLVYFWTKECESRCKASGCILSRERCILHYVFCIFLCCIVYCVF